MNVASDKEYLDWFYHTVRHAHAVFYWRCKEGRAPYKKWIARKDKEAPCLDSE